MPDCNNCLKAEDGQFHSSGVSWESSEKVTFSLLNPDKTKIQLEFTEQIKTYSLNLYTPNKHLHSDFPPKILGLKKYVFMSLF